LLELSRAPSSDWDAYYTGWHIGDYPHTNHYCIQHPKGLTKSYSRYTGEYMPVILANETFSGLPGMGHGQTDGGSVGSPLFDEDMDLVGIFVGGNTRCGVEGGIDRFILLNEVWDAFGQYLNPLEQTDERLPGMELPDPITAGVNRAEMIVYPNPASAYVELAGGPDFEVYSVRLYNSTGELELVEMNQSRIDITGLNEGVYSIHAHTSRGSFSKTLLVSK
ncbi:MAG: T9SS type A sorting domain-containing protein, partial [Flavobacteriales bacterium]